LDLIEANLNRFQMKRASSVTSSD